MWLYHDTRANAQRRYCWIAASESRTARVSGTQRVPRGAVPATRFDSDVLPMCVWWRWRRAQNTTKYKYKIPGILVTRYAVCE